MYSLMGALGALQHAGEPRTFFAARQQKAAEPTQVDLQCSKLWLSDVQDRAKELKELDEVTYNRNKDDIDALLCLEAFVGQEEGKPVSISLFCQIWSPKPPYAASIPHHIQVKTFMILRRISAR